MDGILGTLALNILFPIALAFFLWYIKIKRGKWKVGQTTQIIPKYYQEINGNIPISIDNKALTSLGITEVDFTNTGLTTIRKSDLSNSGEFHISSKDCKLYGITLINNLQNRTISIHESNDYFKISIEYLKKNENLKFKILHSIENSNPTFDFTTEIMDGKTKKENIQDSKKIEDILRYTIFFILSIGCTFLAYDVFDDGKCANDIYALLWACIASIFFMLPFLRYE